MPKCHEGRRQEAFMQKAFMQEVGFEGTGV
jgi:hypothetical protein